MGLVVAMLGRDCCRLLLYALPLALSLVPEADEGLYAAVLQLVQRLPPLDELCMDGRLYLGPGGGDASVAQRGVEASVRLVLLEKELRG